MNTLQIQDAFQPYYAGRKVSGPMPGADARPKPLAKSVSQEVPADESLSTAPPDQRSMREITCAV